MELKVDTRFGLNLSTETEVLSYRYTGVKPVEVVARVFLGATGGGLLSGGGGTYVVNFYINAVPIEPRSTLVIEAGIRSAMIVSRIIPISNNDLISIKALGLGGDTSVDTLSTLRDVTAAQVNDLIGSGAVLVDQNYGGTNALQYVTPLGAGIDNAVIIVYLKTDYDAGNRGNAFVVARTTTTVGGLWSSPLMLDPAVYTLLFYKQGYFGPDAKVVTVTAP